MGHGAVRPAGGLRWLPSLEGPVRSVEGRAMVLLLVGVLLLGAALVLALDALWNARARHGIWAFGAVAVGVIFLFGG